MAGEQLQADDVEVLAPRHERGLNEQVLALRRDLVVAREEVAAAVEEGRRLAHDFVSLMRENLLAARELTDELARFRRAMSSAAERVAAERAARTPAAG